MTGDPVHKIEVRFDDLPLELAGALLRGLDQAARAAGYVAYFRETTGFGTVYFRESPEVEDETT